MMLLVFYIHVHGCYVECPYPLLFSGVFGNIYLLMIRSVVDHIVAVMMSSTTVCTIWTRIVMLSFSEKYTLMS